MKTNQQQVNRKRHYDNTIIITSTTTSADEDSPNRPSTITSPATSTDDNELQHVTKKQKVVVDTSSRSLLLLDQLRQTIHCSSEEVMQHVFSNLIHYVSDHNNNNNTEDVELVKLSDLLQMNNEHKKKKLDSDTCQSSSSSGSSSSSSSRSSKRRILIGRILPRWKTRIHVASLFFTQSDDDELNNVDNHTLNNNSHGVGSKSNEVVCEVISSNDAMTALQLSDDNSSFDQSFNMSYLNHWFMFEDWSFVTSKSIRSIGTAKSHHHSNHSDRDAHKRNQQKRRKFPSASQFSYLEITVDRTRVKCLLQMSHMSQMVIPYFPSRDDLLRRCTIRDGYIDNHFQVKNCAIVGEVVAMCPIFSQASSSSSSSDRVIQFMIRVQIQRIPEASSNKERENLVSGSNEKNKSNEHSSFLSSVRSMSETEEVIIIFSSKVHHSLVCLHHFITVNQTYLFSGLRKVKLSVNAGVNTLHLKTPSVSYYMASAQTYFFPLSVEIAKVSSAVVDHNHQSQLLETSTIISERVTARSTSDLNSSVVSNEEGEIEESMIGHGETIHYEGHITCTARLYTHAMCTIDDQYSLFLNYFPIKNFGRGLRKGVRVRLFNVHPIFAPQNILEQKYELQGFGCCRLSTIQIIKFSSDSESDYRPLMHSIDTSQLNVNGKIMPHEDVWTKQPHLYPHYIIFLQFLEKCKTKFEYLMNEQQLVDSNIVSYLFEKYFVANCHDTKLTEDQADVYNDFVQHNTSCNLVSCYKPAYSDMNNKIPIIVTVSELINWSTKCYKDTMPESKRGANWSVIDNIASNWIILGSLGFPSSKQQDFYFNFFDSTASILVQLLLNDSSQLEFDWNRYRKDVYMVSQFRIVQDERDGESITFLQIFQLKLCIRYDHMQQISLHSQPNEANTTRTDSAACDDQYQFLITFLSDWSYSYNEFTMKALVLQSPSNSIARRSTIQIRCSASFGLGLHSMLRLSTIITVRNPVILDQGGLELTDQSVVKIIEEQDTALQSVRSVLTNNSKTSNKQSVYNNPNEFINMKGYLIRRQTLQNSQIHLVLRDTNTPDTIDVYVKRSHLVGCIPNHVQLILYNVSKRYSSQSGKVYISFNPGSSRIIQLPCTRNQNLGSYSDMPNMKLLSLYSNTNIQHIFSQRAIFHVDSCSIYAIHKFIYQIESKWCNLVCTIDDGTQRALLIIRDIDIIHCLFPRIDEQIRSQNFQNHDDNSYDQSGVIPMQEMNSLKISLHAKLAHPIKKQVNHIIPRADGQFHNPFPNYEMEQNEETKQYTRAEKVVLIAEAVSVLSSVYRASSETRESLLSLVQSSLASLNL